MIWKTLVDNQLFVYRNGELIYKRWVWRGHGITFDPYGLPWSPDPGTMWSRYDVKATPATSTQGRGSSG